MGGQKLDLQILATDATPSVPQYAGAQYGGAPLPPPQPVASQMVASQLRGASMPSQPIVPSPRMTPTQPALVPAVPPSVVVPPQPVLPESVAIDVDLRNCIGNNLPLFESAWTPVLQLFMKAANGQETTVDAVTDVPEMSGELMISMMDLQLAITNCGINPVQEAVLFDAMHSGTVRSRLVAPAGSSLAAQRPRDELSQAFSKALQDYKTQTWTDFGTELGSIVREMVVVAFPEKYSLDDTGKLVMAKLDSLRSIEKSKMMVVSGIAAMCCMILLVATFMAKRRWSARGRDFDRALSTDDEILLEEAVVE